MEHYNLDQSIYDTILNKSTEFKAKIYGEIFLTIDNMNMTPEIMTKIDPSYLEKDLMEILNNLNDDDIITSMDFKMKEVLMEAMEKNGIKLTEDIPLYILADILEQYVLLFNTEQGLSDDLLNIVNGCYDNNQFTFTFIKLLDYYSSIGMGELCNYIENVDSDVLNKLKRKYEEDVNGGYEYLADNYIQNIALFNVKYKTSLMAGRSILSEIKKNQCFNRPFKDIFPLINNELLKEDIGKEEYLFTLAIGYLASKEGYDNIDNALETLDEYGLIQDIDDTNKEMVKIELVKKIKELKK